MRKLMLTSVLLLLLTNIVVLAGVAYNRSGEPLLTLELSERELPLMYSASSKEENSGTTLSLRWQILDPEEAPEYFSTTYGTPAWLDHDKLTELGFDIKEFENNVDKYQYNTGHLTREAILVLEYQGDSYQKALALMAEKVEKHRQKVLDLSDDDDLMKELDDFEKQLTELKVSRTRLYVIDAGLDEEILMQKYANNKNYLLARGEIGLRWNQAVVSGRIRQLYLKQVHVPLPLSQKLVSLADGQTYSTYNNQAPPSYKVQLNIGKRIEPWIESVKRY